MAQYSGRKSPYSQEFQVRPPASSRVQFTSAQLAQHQFAVPQTEEPNHAADCLGLSYISCGWHIREPSCLGRTILKRAACRQLPRGTPSRSDWSGSLQERQIFYSVSHTLPKSSCKAAEIKRFCRAGRSGLGVNCVNFALELRIGATTGPERLESKRFLVTEPLFTMACGAEFRAFRDVLKMFSFSSCSMRTDAVHESHVDLPGQWLTQGDERWVLS